MTTPSAGERIEQERRRRGWPKARLCDEIQRWEYQQGNGDHLGLNPNYVREWETGQRSVSDYYAPKLSAVLGIPIEVFVDRRSRRGRAAPTPARRSEELAQPALGGAREITAESVAVSLGVRDRLLQQWADLALLGQLGQRLLAKILEPQRSLIVDRRTLLKLLGASSAAASLELLRADSAPQAQALETEPTSVNILESLALRYQSLYHSTPPAELMIPVTAHLELVDELAGNVPANARRRLLCNYSQVALLAGRLSFFDLRNPMTARAYYSMALDAARETGDRHLSAATLGHMSFVPAASGGFGAALDLLEGASKHAAKTSVLPSWLAAVEAEIRAKAGDTRASLAAIERAENALVATHEVPAWLDFYDATRLNGFKGFAYLAAGKAGQARTALDTALFALDAGAVKQRAVFLTDLATTYVREGEVGRGCELAGEAAAALATAGYATSAERLHEFRALVRPWQDQTAVKDLDERLARI
jgi:transcriptional regulator with XRE-family HTH domain